MAKYAAGTIVPVAQSKAEIEALLQRFEADQFVSGWDAERAVIGFRIEGRMVRVFLPIPPIEEFSGYNERTGRTPTPAQARNAYDQEQRRRWRALLLVIKAKLEAVSSGISTIEREFLSSIILPDGTTVGEWVAPQIEEVYRSGTMPSLLPGTGQKQITGGAQ